MFIICKKYRLLSVYYSMNLFSKHWQRYLLKPAVEHLCGINAINMDILSLFSCFWILTNAAEGSRSIIQILIFNFILQWCYSNQIVTKIVFSALVSKLYKNYEFTLDIWAKFLQQPTDVCGNGSTYGSYYRWKGTKFYYQLNQVDTDSLCTRFASSANSLIWVEHWFFS